MKRSTLSRLALVSVLLVAVWVGLEGAEGPALDRLVPASASVRMVLRDVPGLKARLSAGGWAGVAADPDLARFFAPVLRQAAAAAVLGGVEVGGGKQAALASRVLDCLAGDVLVAVWAPDFSSDAPVPPPVVLLADVGGSGEEVARILNQAAALRGEKYSVEDYDGVPLGVLQPDGEGVTFFWTVRAGRLLAATDRGILIGVVDALRGGGRPDALADDPLYARGLGRSAVRPDLFVQADLGALFAELLPALEKRPEAVALAGSAPGLEAAALLRSLGFDALRSLEFTSVREGEVDRLTIMLTFSEKRGVLRLMAVQDGPVAAPEWMSVDWINVSSRNFSFVNFYAELEALLLRINPMLGGLILGQVANLEGRLGVYIKEDLLGTMSSRLVEGYAPPAAGWASEPALEDYIRFMAVELANPVRFERALRTVLGSGLISGGAEPALQTREVAGRKLQVMSVGPEERELAWAISDGWFMLVSGDAGVLEAVIRRQAGETGGGGFWARSDVRAALAGVPERAFLVEVADLARTLAAAGVSAARWQEGRPEKELGWVDPAAVPGIGVWARHFKTATLYGEQTKDALIFTVTMPAR